MLPLCRGSVNESPSGDRPRNQDRSQWCEFHDLTEYLQVPRDLRSPRRDTKFTKEFVATLKAKCVRTNALPVASPNLNGRVERFIQTIKYECLFKSILFGHRHLDHIVGQ